MATKGNDGTRAGGGATAATTGATGTTATGRRFNNGFDTTTAAGDDGGGGGGGGGGSSSALVGKINALEKDLERRQESYVARERAYKTRIEELEEELKFQRQEKTGWSRVREPLSGGLMFEDIQMPQMVEIVWHVLRINGLIDFFAVSPSSSETTEPAATRAKSSLWYSMNLTYVTIASVQKSRSLARAIA
jgi:hypothetical protein